MKTKGTSGKTRQTAGAARKHRILIVEDHPVFRDGLAQLIEQEGDLSVCGKANDAAQALRVIASARPDLVLVDIGLPGKSGLELIKDLNALHSGMPVLVISMHEESLYAERALRAGGRGYIMKHESPENTLRAIRQALDGQMCISAKLAPAIFSSLSGRRPKKANSPISRLSDREFEVLDLLGQGKDSHTIAQELHLSFKTVDAHRARIKEKLNLRNSTELISYAARWVETQRTGS
jgi:DNA-binding NarL/FixJ family response regulator